MLVWIAMLVTVIFVLSFSLIFLGGKCLAPKHMKNITMVNERRRDGGYFITLGLLFLILGVAVVIALGYDIGSGIPIDTTKTWLRVTQKNEPYRTVLAFEAKDGYILLICKMYDGKTETGEPKENDCASAKNLTEYLMDAPTPPVFMKTREGEYKELSPEEARLIVSVR